MGIQCHVIRPIRLVRLVKYKDKIWEFMETSGRIMSRKGESEARTKVQKAEDDESTASPKKQRYAFALSTNT